LSNPSIINVTPENIAELGVLCGGTEQQYQAGRAFCMCCATLSITI